MKKLTEPLITIFKTLLAASVVASMVASHADDTEVFYSKNLSKPNLLFVLDNSGSMVWDMDGNAVGSPAYSGPSRVSVLNTAVQSVLASAPDNVNIGVMRFGQTKNHRIFNWDGSRGGTYFEGVSLNESDRTHGVSGVAFPITDINAKARTVILDAASVYGLPYYPAVDETVRTYVAEIVDDWAQEDLWAGTMGTAIVDSLYEAALYYRGEKVHYGFDTPNGTVGIAAHPSTYVAPVASNNISQSPRNYSNAPSYKSPIKSSCGSNYIVLMSDGEPTYGYYRWDGSRWVIPENRGPFAHTMQGNAGFSKLAAAVPSCAINPSGLAQGTCGPELTKYLAENDNIADPSSSNPNGLEGDQLIKTFSIGFGANLTPSAANFLRSLETIDDNPDTPQIEDGYFSATDPASLAQAFKDILTAVAEPRGTLASPGYSVNVKNGLEHENDIYVPVFDRKNSSRWSGNLKKFKLVDVNGRRHIRGKNDLDATNELGGFSADAIDYWSDAPNSNPDGINVQRGGLASKLDNPEDRKVYSNLTSNANLSNPSNYVKTTNMSNLTNSVLGLSSTSTLAYRERIIRFMRGRENGDSNGAPRLHMGDMLHSEPLVLTYNKGNAAGGDKVQYIFAGTNEGYLHAFNTADYTSPDSSSKAGKEIFAFIPKELLGKISEPQFLNSGTQNDHKYGVDGALTAWFNDVNKNGIVDIGSDQVILYFGLRRGGTSYYALDVTDINTPVLLWTKSVDDYASMGQSWSIPYLAKVGVGANKTPTEVMIISGGYDEDEDRDLNDGSGNVDNAQSPVTANVGNDILVLDAKNGNLLWSLSSAQRGQIRSSIPGGVRILDTNYNGLVDRIYFADTGGDVWRLDLTETIGDNTASSDLTKLAELGGTGINARKFFNEPDVAKMKLKGKTVFAVSIGSGFRAHPMDKTIDDKFFVLIDKSPYRALVKIGSKQFAAITSANLANITISSSGISHAGSIKDADKRGWQVNFGDSGEKVLGGAIAIDGNIVFTSLVPKILQATDSNGIDECAAPITQSRFYAINILTGGAGMDLDRSGTVTDGVADTYVTVSTEILGKPQVVYNPLTVTEDVDAQGNPKGTKSCRHPVDIRTGKKLTQTSGYDACRLESVYWSDPVSE